MASSHFTDGRFHITLEEGVHPRYPWALYDAGSGEHVLVGHFRQVRDAIQHAHPRLGVLAVKLPGDFKQRQLIEQRQLMDRAAACQVLERLNGRQDFLDAELTPEDRGE